MNERNYSIDFIRLFAILGVVIIHTSTAFIDRTTPLSFDFYIYQFINQISRFAVPLFFLISGFLLASRYHSINSPLNFYKKRLSKLLPPYILWSIIYYFIVFGNPISQLFTSRVADNIYTGASSYQLYFIPAIIVLYLLFPFIIFLKKYILTKWFIVLLAVITGAILTQTYYSNKSLQIDTPFRIAFYNLLPFIVGIYSAIKINDLNKFIKNNLHFFIFASVITGLSVFFESTFQFIKTNNGDFLRNQWRINVMLYGIFIAPLLYYFYPKYLKKYEKNIYYFSTFALGVFFVHVAILQYVLYFIDEYKLYDPISFILSLGIVLLLSFSFSIILSKVSLLNRFLGLRG